MAPCRGRWSRLVLCLAAVWGAGGGTAEEGSLPPSRRFNIGGVLHDNNTERHFRDALKVSRSGATWTCVLASSLSVLVDALRPLQVLVVARGRGHDFLLYLTPSELNFQCKS